MIIRPELPKVQRVMEALKTDHGVGCSWIPTGGGCYAIEVPLPDYTCPDLPGTPTAHYALITGEDVFYAWDWDSDDDVADSFYADRYTDVGDSVSGERGFYLGDDVSPEVFVRALCDEWKLGA